eukprot:1196220-Prorocentrum_minimum.AAC.5
MRGLDAPNTPDASSEHNPSRALAVGGERHDGDDAGVAVLGLLPRAQAAQLLQQNPQALGGQVEDVRHVLALRPLLRGGDEEHTGRSGHIRVVACRVGFESVVGKTPAGKGHGGRGPSRNRIGQPGQTSRPDFRSSIGSSIGFDSIRGSP